MLGYDWLFNCGVLELMKKTFLLLLVHVSVYAQNAGRQYFSFLNLPANARTVAQGGLNVSRGNSNSSFVFNNPALADSSFARHLSLTATPFLAGSNYLALAFSPAIKTPGFWSAGFQFLNYGDLIGRDEASNETGRFTANDYAFTVSYARSQGNFTLGTSLKLAGSGIESYRATGLLFDLGTVWRHPKKTFQIGLLAKNLGWLLRDFTSNGSASMPFDLQVGITIKPAYMPVRVSLTAHHLHDFDIVFNDPAVYFSFDNNGIKIPRGVRLPEKIARHLVLSAELLIHKNMNILLGYNHLRRQELLVQNIGGTAGLSFGAVFVTSKYSLTYARGQYHQAGGANSISFGFNLNKKH